MKPRSKSLFARIMAVVLTVILLLAAATSALGWVTLRNRQINTRLEALKKEAREIAWLAGQNQTDSMLTIISGGSTTQDYIRMKSQAVYNEYGAYILVLDRRGRVMDNMREAYANDPAFVASLNGKELYQAMLQVLDGEEISIRAMVDGAPTFTVGVPFIRGNYVLGAVLIQTKAQQVEGGLTEWLWRMLLAALAASVLAFVGVFLYVRTAMRPLRQMTAAAKAMAAGDFAVRVQPHQATRETMELSEAFNMMADKLGNTEASRREFVANVSHELRSPVTSIAGFVEGMRDGTIPPEEHDKYLTVVSDETHRLSKLIGDLLALSRLERDDASLTLTSFDMCELLRRAIIRRMNDLEAKRLEMVCDFRADPCIVCADQDRIDQVVVNLLDNAIKFTPEGGCLTFVTEREGSLCTVRVSDNGVGIAPEDRPRVFDRFFTADRAHTSGKGTGLGLAISQRILEMHRHALVLEDTAEGASFMFQLDAGEAPQRAGRTEVSY